MDCVSRGKQEENERQAWGQALRLSNIVRIRQKKSVKKGRLESYFQEGSRTGAYIFVSYSAFCHLEQFFLALEKYHRKLI